MEGFIAKECEALDASVFSGDELRKKVNRDGLKIYIARWVRKIKEWEEITKDGE